MSPPDPIGVIYATIMDNLRQYIIRGTAQRWELQRIQEHVRDLMVEIRRQEAASR